MTGVIFISGAICILASFGLVVESVRRLRKEHCTLNWSLLALSGLWAAVYVCGTLRLGGVLQPINDALTTRQISNIMGSSMAPIAVIGFTILSIVIDGLLWVLLRKITEKNKLWWICGSFFVFLLFVLVIACVARVMNGDTYSIDQLFFAGCCASMAIPGWALGFTYKEICVIVNIYLEAGVCLLSALWLMKVLLQRCKRQPSATNTMLSVAVIGYAVVYIVAFIGIVAYYPPPLAPSFDKCYRDLMRWAGEYDSTYNYVNYIIFIAGFLVPVIGNLVIGKMLQVRKKE